MPATLKSVSSGGEPPAVCVTSAPDVSGFRIVFERSLGRAGFRVFSGSQPAEICTLSVTLLGDGSGTGGMEEGRPFARQFNKVDASVFQAGKLKTELHTGVNYVIVCQEKEEFGAFTARVSQAASQGYEYMAVDLTNQLVGVASR